MTDKQAQVEERRPVSRATGLPVYGPARETAEVTIEVRKVTPWKRAAARG